LGLLDAIFWELCYPLLARKELPHLGEHCHFEHRDSREKHQSNRLFLQVSPSHDTFQDKKAMLLTQPAQASVNRRVQRHEIIHGKLAAVVSAGTVA
jgi:hypothetical protein